MRCYALFVAAVGAVFDKATLLDPWRGVRPASKAERSLLEGRWL